MKPENVFGTIEYVIKKVSKLPETHIGCEWCDSVDGPMTSVNVDDSIGSDICNECFENLTKKCDTCGDIYHQEYVGTDSDGDNECESCYEYKTMG